ncbi:Nif3-like dinuclear metal center hexameric protein [Buchnera aphidicola (Aphis craccivora)]|uniref:GTP cyclohydrolase 1 type 2 homolog n=1 Tax=Buchnera aphidicola (Aphis craccivora) TaxID=466616 RepID=A0A4D6XN38_9GAMM|nr:Nif3-like dinuclear metal center hexameric protein [Buchnera aphidicola]QCI16547.1 Nif3-like dinuclear metal center hexameric protein [Buchnera aphidicola (Aphis craccivora)]QLL40681.1 Nif3-like dinuclear metal center hexameric protein [Buchnera aphidicola (Aphis craccivore)]WAI17519.1 MAG: Nif3-like dinuclear metal center hexameric protein [Buchnera aphidicola (Aphis craccivora)]
MENFVLEKIINEKLFNKYNEDIVPNGLQIEGDKIVKKIITGVSVCQDLLNSALYHKANAIIVHHGYFWSKDSKYIHHVQKNRLKTILTNNINLYSWHLPLDIHPELGNNIQISKKLNISVKGEVFPYVLWGVLEPKISGFDFSKKIEKIFKKKPIHFYQNAPDYISRIAWCTGKGQNFIKQAYKFGIDAFLTGEVSEETIYISKELGIHFFALGHYCSEKYGIKALGKWLQKTHNLDVIFIDIYNPA